MRKEYLRKLINQREPGEWLILALAFSVTLLHAGLLLVDIYQGNYGLELLLRGIGRLLTVYLMILAWRLRKSAFRKAITCSIASMLLLMCSNYVYEEYIFQALLLLLGPICLFRLQKAFQNRFRSRWAAPALALAVWLSAVAGASLLFCLFSLSDFDEIWFIYPLLLAEAAASMWLSQKRFEKAEFWRTTLLRWWAACLLLVLWILNEYRVADMRYDPCWFGFVSAGLPFFLAVLLRFLKGKLRSPWLSGGAFFACVLILFLCNLSTNLGPSRELYYICLPLIIYTIEGAEDRGSACPHVLRAGYALLCGGLTFAVNERLRTVFYDLGGPAVNISVSARVDWLAYRLAGLKSFFAGSAQPFEELLGYPGYGDHYKYIFASDDIGAAIFGHGWWWLPVMLALVTLVSVLLLKTQWTNPAHNYCKNEFALSFFLRAAINLPAALFMYSTAGVTFPFSLHSMMDLMWLWLLFDRNMAVQRMNNK